jgi:hypothetical protein
MLENGGYTAISDGREWVSALPLRAYHRTALARGGLGRNHLMEPAMLQPAVIAANALLVWFVQELFFGIGFCLAWNLIGLPFRRWLP